jgi:lipopolysaccharide transport system permease protein
MLRSMWRDLKDARELSWRLFVRDWSAQYRQSVFGILWSFLPPVVTGLIFIFLQSRNVVNFGPTDIPYGLYVMVGVVLWQLFTESVNAPLKSVTAAKPLLVKISFPREAVVLSCFYMVGFNAVLKLIVIAAFFLFYRATPTWGLLAAPAAIRCSCSWVWASAC